MYHRVAGPDTISDYLSTLNPPRLRLAVQQPHFAFAIAKDFLVFSLAVYILQVFTLLQSHDHLLYFNIRKLVGH
jgi:hypothetical protein